jgi:membrane protein
MSSGTQTGIPVTELALMPLRRLRSAWMYIVRIVERMEDNHIFLSAAGISFNALLCFIPLILLILSLLGWVLDAKDAMGAINQQLQNLDLFPYQRERISGLVAGAVDEFISGSYVAGIIGGVGLLWTASALFAALRTALNRIFHVRDTMNILVSKLKDFALLSIVGVLMIVAAITMYAGAILHGLGQNVFGFSFDHWLIRYVTAYVAPSIINLVMFMVAFAIVPDRRIGFRALVLTSTIATFFWAVSRTLFIYYAENLWSLGSVYGPYALIVATALWIYYSSITVLLAAEIGEMYLERRQLRNLFSEPSLQATLRHATPPELPR